MRLTPLNTTLGDQMKQRVDAGTDIALIGVWDQARSRDVIPKVSMKQYKEILSTDAEQGHIFLLRLGGDWGGPIDVYVDSSMESRIKRKLKELPGEFLLSAPSGRVIVGGAEDYRSSETKITSESSVVSLQPGQYGLKCYMLKSDSGEIPDTPSPEVIETAVGKESYAYYQSRNRWSTRGFWLFLLFLPCTFWFGWIVGIVATLGIVLAFFHLVEWYLKRDPKYVEIDKAVVAAIVESQEKMPPSFAIKLRRLKDGHGIQGGHLDLCEAQGKIREKPGQRAIVSYIREYCSLVRMFA